MATAEDIKQDIVDFLNEKHGGKYGVYTLDEFTSAFYQFVEDFGWGQAEIELASGTAKVVEFEDAGEGDYSADTHLIFSVNGQIFRVDGHYESWAGTEWESNDLYEATPVPVLVTEYQRKVL